MSLFSLLRYTYRLVSRIVTEVWSETNDTAISALANAGFRLVMSNSDALYLDCGVGNWADEGPFYCDPYKQWRDLYDYSPRDVSVGNITIRGQVR